MKRIQMVLAALAIVVTSLAAFAVPAMADDLDCRDAKGDLIRCDGDLYEPYDRDSYYDDNDYNDYFDNDYFDNDYDDYYFFFSPYNYYSGFDNDYYYYDGCEGPVCLID